MPSSTASAVSCETCTGRLTVCRPVADAHAVERELGAVAVLEVDDALRDWIRAEVVDANTLEIVTGAQSVSPQLFGAEAERIFRDVDSVLILACGTSYHAGMSRATGSKASPVFL